jgi:hypothetical protein
MQEHNRHCFRRIGDLMASDSTPDDPSRAYDAAKLHGLRNSLEALSNLLYLIRHSASEPKDIEKYAGMADEILTRIIKAIAWYDGIGLPRA